jgi:hypothetical protein
VLLAHTKIRHIDEERKARRGVGVVTYLRWLTMVIIEGGCIIMYPTYDGYNRGWVHPNKQIP